MVTKFILLTFFLVLFSCENKTIYPTKHSPENLNRKNYVGIKIDKLISDYGLPTEIVLASKYSTKFIGVEPIVVFEYQSIKKIIYVDKESKIVAVYSIDDTGEIKLDPEQY